jgi:hypothetical protein
MVYARRRELAVFDHDAAQGIGRSRSSPPWLATVHRARLLGIREAEELPQNL